MIPSPLSSVKIQNIGEILLGVIRQNIAGWCQQTFCIAIFCLHNSRKLFFSQFQFSLKVKVMGSNPGYLLKFFYFHKTDANKDTLTLRTSFLICRYQTLIVKNVSILSIDLKYKLLLGQFAAIIGPTTWLTSLSTHCPFRATVKICFCKSW